MRLYIVIYLAGLVGGTVGPLPYDEAECERRVSAQMASLDRGVTTPSGYTADDVDLRCEWHTERPILNPKAGNPKGDSNG